jgi:hypothetical protein
MFRPRAVLAITISSAMLIVPAMPASTSATPARPNAAAVGTVTAASGARVGTATASSGSTIFGGDHLSTESAGSIQVRTGAARLLLSGASSAAMGESETSSSATLLSGTAVFSTANAKAFTLHAATADIRPESSVPTVAQVTYISPKELRVRSTRGSLAITVDGETKIVPEASAYQVILDPSDYYAKEDASSQGPQGAGGRGGRGPLKAGRSHFLLIAIVVTGVVTGVALYEALQSPDKP